MSRRALAGSRYRQLFRGVYLPVEANLDLATWVAAARLVLPADARVTGLTALRLRRLDVGEDLPLHFVTASRGRNRHAGTQVEQRRGLQHSGGVAPPLEAFAEVCQRSSLLEAVQVGDRMVHRRLASLDDIRRLSAEHGRVGVASSLVRAGAESVKETHLRLLCVLAGLPEPTLQATIHVGGRWVGRVDLLIEEQRLVLEYEGRQHLSDTAQWNRDITRYDFLRDGGYRVVRVTAESLQDPEALVGRIASEIRARGWTGPAPRLGGLWRDAFLPRTARRRADAA
ncbi:MAG TPA: DUF559 domain-containing protein [Propionibacteriaceae bacterium]|nr:DUF559 domain-containing protein [Propionibacteriaceae bacterium]